MSVLSTGLVRKKVRKSNPVSTTGVPCHIFTPSFGLMFTGGGDGCTDPAPSASSKLSLHPVHSQVRKGKGHPHDVNTWLQ